MQRLFRPLLLVLWLWPLATWAGPPFLTDDPDPVDYGTFEAIPNFNFDRATVSDTIVWPGMDFNYGIWPDMHLNLGPGFVHFLPVRGTPAYGLGDTRIALKWRFVHETDDSPEVAFYPATELPTGSAGRGTGNGQAWYQLPLWLEKNWGKWTSYGGAGWTRNHAPSMRDYFYGGWLLQNQVSDSLFLGGEIYSTGSIGTGYPGFTALNLGGGYAFNKHLSLIFSGGHSIAGGSNMLGYIGLDCTW